MEKEKVDYAWFVGATGDPGEGWKDFADEYITAGVWVNGRTENVVNTIKPGDHIVLKSTSKKEKGLPFDNKGQPVGFAVIKAIGVVKENPQDGKNLLVDWTRLEEPKVWYTSMGFLRGTVYCVKRGSDPKKNALLDFVFADVAQDYSLCEAYYATRSAAQGEEILKEADETGVFDFSLPQPLHALLLTPVDENMTEAELSGLLKEWHNQGGGQKMAALVAFGIKYANMIKRLNIPVTTWVTKVLGTKTGAIVSYGVWLARTLQHTDLPAFFGQTQPVKTVAPVANSVFQTAFGHNHIVFGAPGTGKSHALEKEAKKLREAGGYFERVTFHPDYTYASFVGTYKPTPAEGGTITYRFVAGPFIRAYVEAKRNPSRPVLLLIEEINRASVAAVFGDIFQLLDRVEKEEDGVVGESKYPVAASEDLRSYLAKVGVMDCETLTLPSNLYIFASMNSADQGVYPMDTAFKRRWSFTYIGINDGEEEIEKVTADVDGKLAKKWNDVRRKINEALARFGINEDKQIGPFFLSPAVLTDETRFREAFKSKVLMYLYEDAARHKRDKLFAKSGARYSEICDAFDKEGYAVFSSTVYETGDQG